MKSKKLPEDMIGIFIINLSNRKDRWISCVEQLSTIDIPAFRVDAVPFDSLKSNELRFAPAGVVATWESHQKAARQFLESPYQFGLILEDDFKLRRGIKKKLVRLTSGAEYDYLQLGFLFPHYLDFLTYFVFNLQDYLLKFLSAISIRFKFAKPLKSKHTVVEQVGVDRKIVLNDVRAGGHGYLINRNFAQAMECMNRPVFLSADGVFMAISVSRNFRMARLRKSIVAQSGSESSVTYRIKALELKQNNQ